jgi:Co/Zn/Cd efflux system component
LHLSARRKFKFKNSKFSGIPVDTGKEDLEQDLLNIAGVKSVHSLNIWSLTMDRNVITAHITVGKHISVLTVGKLI